MTHNILFSPSNGGWFSTHEDLDLWAYKSSVGWSLVYSHNAIPGTKAKVFVSDSVHDIGSKVLELTGKFMQFSVMY